MSRLAGKVVLITGGNSGIGLETAGLFLREGAKVAITGRNQERLIQAATSLGGELLPIRADTTDPEAMSDACRSTFDRWGRFDVVFANAGIAGTTPLALASVNRFEEILRTNLTGTFITVAASEPYLNDGASIILTGSVMADLGFPGASGYAATKGALRSMAKSLAGELAPRGIRVNVLAPGPIRSPIWTAERLEAIASSVPLDRAGEVQEIAAAALFLASPDSSYMTAAELLVDGGSLGTPAGAPIYRT